MYNDLSDTNPPLGHDIDKFVFGQTVVVKFQVHLLNFWMSKNPEAKFKYTFQNVSLYLVQLAEKHDFLMLSRRKCSSNK